MKKLVVAILAGVLTLGILVGCASKKAESTTQETTKIETTAQTSEDTEQKAVMSNPMTETDEKGMQEKTGITLKAPEGAEKIQYFVIDTGDEKPIAELRFTIGGKDYTYRAQLNGATKAEDNSGMAYTWKETKPVKVSYCEGTFETCDEATVIYWADVVPGINYSLSTNSAASEQDMTKMAETIFVPAQGDS